MIASPDASFPASWLAVLVLVGCSSAGSASDAGTTASDVVDAGGTADTGTPTDAPRAAGTVTLSGSLGATAADVGFQPSTGSCGGATGISLATSGALITCGGPLGTALHQPYQQIRMSRQYPGTYALVAEGVCTTSTTTRCGP